MHYLFAEDVLGCTEGHRPRDAESYRNFSTEYAHPQAERIAAFREISIDVNKGGYLQRRHRVTIQDMDFEAFWGRLEGNAE